MKIYHKANSFKRISNYIGTSFNENEEIGVNFYKLFKWTVQAEYVIRRGVQSSDITFEIYILDEPFAFSILNNSPRK